MCHQRLSLEINKTYHIDLKPMTVYRILKRNDLIKSKVRYQRKKRQIKFFYPDNAGELVQLDTKHLIKSKRYQYAFIDVATRYSVCIVTTKINQKTTIDVFNEVQKQFPFEIKLIQTDNGPEFQRKFVKHLTILSIKHRYIRVRTPRHNGFVERLHKTIDQEFWQKTSKALLTNIMYSCTSKKC
jgi:transposase InsO family protein